MLQQEERSKVDDLRGTPMAVGTLEEIIDDNHAIVSTSVGSEYYVNMLSFVHKDLIEPGCTVLLNNKASTSVDVIIKYFNIIHNSGYMHSSYSCDHAFSYKSRIIFSEI